MKKIYHLVIENKPIISFYFLAMFILLVIFIVPPILLTTFKSSLSTPVTNFVTLALCTWACYKGLERNGWNWRKEIVKNLDIVSVFAYFTFTLAGIIFLFLIQFPLNLEFKKENMNLWHFVFVIPVCLAQVISYQEYLPRKLRLFTKSKLVIVIVCAIFFTMMHIMFRGEFTIICSIGGIGFSWMYLYYPSPILMTLSHGTLNIITGYMGAFNT